MFPSSIPSFYKNQPFVFLSFGTVKDFRQLVPGGEGVSAHPGYSAHILNSQGISRIEFSAFSINFSSPPRQKEPSVLVRILWSLYMWSSWHDDTGTDVSFNKGSLVLEEHSQDGKGDSHGCIPLHYVIGVVSSIECWLGDEELKKGCQPLDEVSIRLEIIWWGNLEVFCDLVMG